MREIVLVSGTALVAITLTIWAIRFRRPSRTMIIWLGDLENDLRRYNEICLEKASYEVRLRHLLDKLPKDFEFPVFEAMRMGAAAETMVRERAIELGLISDDRLKNMVAANDAKPSLIEEAPASRGPATVWDEKGRQRPRLAS